ncbi:MAG: BatD family protein [Candidatus Kapabacteria bacterium]|nr:BatD family protein [Candidatus Kapabacteria bacterium]
MNHIVIMISMLILITSSIFGQSVKLTTDKDYYEFDEIIKVEITIDFKEDSVLMPDFESFVIVYGPTTSSSMTITSGKTSRTTTWNYHLRPIVGGNQTINSPVFIFKDETYQDNDKSISISDGSLGKQELERLKFEHFIDLAKPNDTYRYTIGDEFGYIEIRSKGNWIIHRRLTKDEMDIIRKVE